MTDYPTFEAGDVISLDGERYTVVSVDPDPDHPDGIRAYYLDAPDNESVRLEPPNQYAGKWGFVRAASYEVDDVEVVE